MMDKNIVPSAGQSFAGGKLNIAVKNVRGRANKTIKFARYDKK